jgi:hypothetical protein
MSVWATDASPYSDIDYTRRRTPKSQHDPDYSWRYACPDGHRSLETRATGGYYCRTCQTRYPGNPRDLRGDDA